MKDITKLGYREICMLMATTDLTGAEVYDALRAEFLKKRTKTAARAWERFWRHHPAMFHRLTDEDIALLREVKG
jgi:hypothetical protein